MVGGRKVVYVGLRFNHNVDFVGIIWRLKEIVYWIVSMHNELF